MLVNLTEQVSRSGIREPLVQEAGQIFSGQIILAEYLMDTRWIYEI